MTWVPRPSQLRILGHILATPAAAVWARVGSGKTSATLAALKVMREKAGWRALVVAPKHVALHVWAPENEKWGFGLKVEVLHGPKKNEAVKRDADVYVVNYDGLAWLAQKTKLRPEVLVLDESSKCRNTDTGRFKTLRDVFLPSTKRRIALSGTPKPNGEMNLFGQYRLLDGGARLGKYITMFRNTYCYQTGYGGYTWELLPGASELIRRAVQDITIVVDDTEDGYPDVHVRDLEVPLPDEARAVYAKLEREFFAELEGAEVTAVNAAAKVSKLRQVASGAVYADQAPDTDAWASNPEWYPVHDARLDALDAFVEEASGPVLLFYSFNHEAARIQKQHPEAVIFSRLSDRARAEAIDEWNRGKIELLCAHPASAGHGLNLQHGGHEMLWFSLTYDLEHYEQAVGRLARQGQQSKVVRVTRMVSPDTIDEVMAKRLESKAKGQRAFLDAIKEYALKFGDRAAEKQARRRAP